jgi:hypothetical protein
LEVQNEVERKKEKMRDNKENKGREMTKKEGKKDLIPNKLGIHFFRCLNFVTLPYCKPLTTSAQTNKNITN